MRPAALVVCGVLPAAAAFVWLTGASMPPQVASHFGFGGAADAFMSRDGYVATMIGVVVGVPLFVVAVGSFATAAAASSSPAAGAVLRRATPPFAAALSVYLSFVHWLVVRANDATPARLSNAGLYGGLAVFGLVAIAWMVTLGRRLRAPPM